MDKNELRSMMKKMRDCLEENIWLEESMELCNKILGLEEYKKARKILSFMNFGSEIKIEILNKEILKAGKELYLPRIEKNVELSVIRYGENFSIGKFGIKEPIGKKYFGELDMIITPGLVFDRFGNRIGYGKGYYDRLFLNYPDTFKLAPIFNFQLLENIQVEEHDIALDMIITKNEILRIKKY